MHIILFSNKHLFHQIHVDIWNILSKGHISKQIGTTELFSNVNHYFTYIYISTKYVMNKFSEFKSWSGSFMLSFCKIYSYLCVIHCLARGTWLWRRKHYLTFRTVTNIDRGIKVCLSGMFYELLIFFHWVNISNLFHYQMILKKVWNYFKHLKFGLIFCFSRS